MLGSVVAMIVMQSTIATHPKLQAQTSYDRALVHVPDLLKEISQQTGLDIRAANDLWDLKLDLYTTGQPIGQTLAAVAELVDGTWEPTSLGFVLKQSTKRRELEASYLKAEEDFARKNAEKEISICRRIAQLIPATEEQRIDPAILAQYRDQKVSGITMRGNKNFLEDFKPTRDDARARFESAKAKGLAKDQLEELEIEYLALDRIAKGNPPLVKSRLISQLTNKELEAYKSGLPFACSTTFEGRFRIHPSDDFGGFVSFKNGELVPTKTFGITQITPETYELVYVEYAFGENAAGISGGPERTSPVSGIPEQLESHPFIKLVRQWDQSKEARTLWTQKFGSIEKTAWPSPYFTKAFRFGDHLKWLHKTTKQSVIALSDRMMHPWLKLERPFATTGDYLQGLSAANGASIRKSGEFLLARNGQFWRKRQYELPEAWYARLEGKKNLNYRDYAKAATPLTNAQANLLNSSRGFLATFDSTPFEGALWGLKMFGSLDDAQAQRAVNGGIGFSELNREQLALARYTIVQAVLNGNFVPESFLLEVIERGNNPATYQGMSFEVELNRQNTIMRGGYSQMDGEEVRMREDMDYKDVKMTDFSFYRNGTRILQMHGYAI